MFEYETPTASQIERAVQAGGRWMDATYPGWAETLRLDRMNLADQDSTPIAMVDPDWADTVTTKMVRAFGLFFDESLGRALVEFADKAWAQEINLRAPVARRLRMPILQAS